MTTLTPSRLWAGGYQLDGTVSASRAGADDQQKA
jgi:hypothetical protein